MKPAASAVEGLEAHAAQDATVNKSSYSLPTSIERLLDYAATLTVPHNYFTHFYVTSVVCSLFWAWYLRILDSPSARQIPFFLMLMQGVRRCYESWAYTSSSTSRMWFAHYVLGLAFYIAINMAIWIDGPVPADENALWKIILLSPGIAFAYVAQHSYHSYLYDLRVRNQGYQLPSHWLFPNLLCPHYTCDVIIYALLSFVAAPEGHVVSWSLVCGTIFTAVNLGVTADGTKQWYMAKFGAERVKHRKRMVPGLW